MKTMQNTAAGVSTYQQPSPQFIPVPVPQEKEAKPDVVEELMKKMFMRKVMAKFFGAENEDEDDDDKDDFFGVDDDEKFAEMLFFSKQKNRNRFKRQSDLYELGDRL